MESRNGSHRARILPWGILGGICLSLSLTGSAALAVGFNQDIRPILSENCFACHGPDPGTRKAGLRLDLKESFFASREKSGPPVVPGKPDQSPLYQRLITDDPDELMPPAKSHKQLKPAEKELVKSWIVAGAPWQPHWSFLKPERPSIPQPTAPSLVRNPIDAFVQAKLTAKGLKPSPEADRRTLARRLALDLTGLPAHPEEIENFVSDTSKDAFEKLVRRYQNSQQWGEHRGRYWLDAARYADTHGLHFDNYREMWPYRDWVIEAFNRNQPFDQFTLEQIAGDLLPDPTQDQLVATGFHRCNLTTNEGGTIEEENLAMYARDRVETTSWVWLGLTANCAVCHDHKFDPLTTKDFYGMSAFFRNTTQTGFDGNVKDSNPSMVVIQSGPERARYEALPRQIEAAQKNVESLKETAKTSFDAWATQASPNAVSKHLDSGLALHAPLQEGTGNVRVTLNGEVRKVTPSTGATWTSTEKGKLGPGLLFPAKSKLEIPGAGDFERTDSFSAGGWVFVAPGYNDTGSVFARMDPEAGYRGWDLWFEQGTFGAHFVNRWPENAFKVKTRQRVAKKGEWQHVFLTYDGSSRPEGVKIYVDGRRVDLEKASGSEVKGSIRTQVPFTLGQRSKGDHFYGGGVQDLRIYPRVLKAGEVRGLARAKEWRETFYQPVVLWDKEIRADLFEYYLNTQRPEYETASRQVADLEREREGIRLRFPVTHIQREKTNSMPMARLLFRGQYDQPRDELKPTVFAALNPLPAKAPSNRLGLAQWLVSADNPLMARVVVNRFWQEIFGTGLVKTSEDFGIMGELPSNQELLDWLAVEFRESGWDVKKLFRLIVESHTYRQTAATTPELLEKDPANRLLSRGPRFRMDAEMVRDYALAVSGLLVPKIGGPSVKPYQPDGVWESVAMPESNTKKYQRDSAEGLYRRSLYTFWKRHAPPAAMDVFNAPSRETSCLRRERSNTPLQALNTLNDIQFIEAARNLAQSALKAGGNDAEAALQEMARRALGRTLNTEELAVANTSLQQFLTYYQQNSSDATQLVSYGESKPDPSLSSSKLAAYTLAANQLLNLDEVLNK